MYVNLIMWIGACMCAPRQQAAGIGRRMNRTKREGPEWHRWLEQDDATSAQCIEAIIYLRVSICLYESVYRV